ncbi:cell division protein FtsQ/DivIB [Roseomonas sp. PWR1]|uniref:Cell division protein FtsQ n=1 Tax=Roseomonas nitratireducens TaxID=2820810 RepID=A0ABS4AR09_9PROT|nr:cell division protein FtsQ/DivIB [Neoroseomonas nitratireducens]MBP0463793.1 cell division protein FtsQ/DivIB [Neoroseomonas nitratireducens]
MAREPSRGGARERLAASSARKDPARPSRLRIWLKRRRSLLRPALYGVAGLGAVAVLFLAVRAIDPAGRVRGVTDSFDGLGEGMGLTVQHVILEGRHNTPTDMIRSALGVSRGDPILDVSPEALRRRLETIAWVQRAHVERRLPGTLLIRIEERRPFAIWQHNGRFVIIDREGKVVAADGLDQFGPLPLLVGAGADATGAALYDLLRAERDVHERVQAMVRIHERRWNLRLHNGTDVLLPEGAEGAAIQRLAELQREARLLDRPLAAIDLRLPDRLVLRPTRQAEPAEQPTPQQASRARRG